MNGHSEQFLSCDWGTSSFRLRWVSQGAVIREARESTGAKALDEEARRLGGDLESARADVFSGFLRERLNRLAERGDGFRIPLVISGMASSTVGWREVPYASVPFPLDGRGVRFEELHWASPEWIGKTCLISGVATAMEMMRGEEMEIIGLLAAPELKACRQRCVLVLPGTHSKHVWIQDEAVVDFGTAMTGELFEVLGRHSLLRASVDLAETERRGPAEEIPQAARRAFLEGVDWGSRRGISGGLFRVRTRAVLEGRPADENTWFLSGFLIGAELQELTRPGQSRPLVLGGSGRLGELYGAALRRLMKDEPEGWFQVPADSVEHAVVTGHARFLEGRHPEGIRKAD